MLYIVFPNRDSTFDKGREYTDIDTLFELYKKNDFSKWIEYTKVKILEHYINSDGWKYEDLINQIDFDHQIRSGAAHLHLWGESNTVKFLQIAMEKMGLRFTIEKFEMKMGELRYILKKSF